MATVATVSAGGRAGAPTTIKLLRVAVGWEDPRSRQYSTKRALDHQQLSLCKGQSLCPSAPVQNRSVDQLIGCTAVLDQQSSKPDDFKRTPASVHMQ